MSIIHDPALYQLRHALRGHVYDPGEPEYEDARTLFNAMVETRPRHVARVSHPHQVSAALAFARTRDMRVAVRGGGHSVAGASLVEDGLVIDVRGLRELVVDAERRVVRVGGGLTWGEVDAATQEHGLATVGGRVSSTGVAGLALGGGSGWLERKHGLTVDNILAVELITAERRADPRVGRRAPRAVLGAARRRRELRRRDRDRAAAPPGRARGDGRPRGLPARPRGRAAAALPRGGGRGARRAVVGVRVPHGP